MENYKYLLNIDSPSALRQLPEEALPTVCEELRRFIIDACSRNPGHLASSLGVVELTVALHYVFDTPEDQIVWDVGHQAYGHKILTGRREAFDTNRQLGGLRPFPFPEESEYDTFVCGHAGNSVAVALGLNMADIKAGNRKRKVVAVIGDGSMSSGLAFEGMNNASNVPNNLLIILNDNNMSIDRSVGGMKKYLQKFHTSSGYNKVRFSLSRSLRRAGLFSDNQRRRIIRFNNALKSFFLHQQNMFEGLDIRYFGPADGHDVVNLVRVLREIKDMGGPKLLHINTVKGKGLTVAEEAPTIWHAPGTFDPDSGERLEHNTENLPPKFQEVFGHTLLELARQNDRIVGVTPAMATGCSMDIMRAEMPKRVFDVGIAEGFAVTYSGGMAKAGLQPFCNIYSAFAQRSYDNIIHDVAMLGLPVVLCLDRAGIVGEDGATHHGAFDISSLRTVPNITLSSPYDEQELRRLMYTAQLPDKGLFVIRYPRGRGRLVDWHCPLEAVEVGRGRLLHKGTDMAVLSFGPIGNVAADAIRQIEAEKGVSVAHYDLRFAKPLDADLLNEVASRFDRVLTIEDGALQGGVGSAVLEFFSDHGQKPTVRRLGLPDEFVEHGSCAQLYHLLGLDKEGIIKAISEMLQIETIKTGDK
ncbi:MAG: 1-deoxy-D-xylulose-5-phosphate synthase [Alloprevotella sp.]|nr:1-deoxy-D-xylulose-5-phosphate synthase [Alloprevotella sp.]